MQLKRTTLEELAEGNTADTENGYEYFGPKSKQQSLRGCKEVDYNQVLKRSKANSKDPTKWVQPSPRLKIYALTVIS